MTNRVPIKHLFDLSRKMVSPTDFGNKPLFHYSLPAWHEHADGIVENASDLASGKLLLGGDEVLVSKLNPEKSAVILAEKHEIPTVCSPEFVALLPRAINRRFSYYFMLSAPLRHQLNASVESVTNSHKRARVDLFLASKVELPAPETQKAIAAFLDRETARIDQLIEKKQRFLKLTDIRWQATLDHFVLGKSIPEQRFAVDHPVIQDIPSTWRLTPLKHLVDQDRPIMYGIVLPGPNMEEGPLIVKGGDVKPGRLHPDKLCRTTQEIESRYERSRLKAGDLVISIRGGIGDIEIVPEKIEGANLTQDAARIAPRRGIDREWLRYAVMAPSVFAPLEAQTLGAAVRGINIFDLKRVSVPTPPPEAQREIAETLNAKVQTIAALKQKITTHAALIREYRSALITAAVTGQIDVTTWGKRGETDRRLDEIEEEMSA